MIWLVSVASAVEIQRAPYLQSTTETSTTIVWRTDELSFGQVRYGTDPALLDQRVDDDILRIQHEVTLTDLVPGERVYYSVHTGKGELLSGGDDHFIETIPSDTDHLRVWVVGDSGTALPFQTETRDAMVEITGLDRPDLFLHMGDMAYSDGTTAEFDERFYGIYTSILHNTTVWPTIGNHEGHTSRSRTQTGPYYEGYVLPTAGEAGGVASGTEAYYAFDVAMVHFVVLDSYGSDRREDAAMWSWLEEDLAANELPWVIAYWHHPPYTDGSHNSDVEPAHVEMRELAVPILEAGGVDLVLGGHSHSYERSYLLHESHETPSTHQGIVDRGDGRAGADGPYEKVDPDGAVYIVAGHGGTGNSGRLNHPVMAFEDLMNGSVILDITPERLTIRNIRMNRQVNDEAVLLQGDAIVLVEPDGDVPVLAGHARPIRWWSPDDAPVDIEWTCDGETWETLAEGVTGGRWMWDVPTWKSTEARVRITDTQGRTDVSDGRFDVKKRAHWALPYGSVWSVWDEPTYPGATWMEVDFDDSGWTAMRAEIGVGDGDERAQLEARDETRTSVYFRRVIDLPGEVTEANMRVIYDDGAAVFVNGQLVSEQNLIDLKHESWAEDEDWDNSTDDVIIDPGVFRVGENTIAVVVKNDEGSADTSFDLELQLRVEDTDQQMFECGEETEVIGIPPEKRCATLGAGAAWWLALPALLWVRRRW